MSWCCNFFSLPRGSSAAGAGPSWVGGTRAMPSGEIWGGNGPTAVVHALIGLSGVASCCDWRLATGVTEPRPVWTADDVDVWRYTRGM